jgi:hypothetical protein
MHLESRSDTDVCFTVEFRKARERTPKNKADFQTTCISLVEDTWRSQASALKPKKLSDTQRLALDVLANCILDQGQPSPASFQLPADIKVVTVEAWRDALFSRGVLKREAKNPRQPFHRLKLALLGQYRIGERDGFIWMAKKEPTT